MPQKRVRLLVSVSYLVEIPLQTFQALCPKTVQGSTAEERLEYHLGKGYTSMGEIYQDTRHPDTRMQALHEIDVELSEENLLTHSVKMVAEVGGEGES